MKSYFAILDIGGSGVKLSCRSEDGMDSFTEREHLLPVIQEQSATQHPGVMFETLLRILRKCGERLGSTRRVRKIYISTLRQGFTLLRDDEELTSLIYNSDSTGSSSKDDVKDYGMHKIYEETGHWYAPQLTLPKLVHLKRASSDIFRGDVSLSFFHDWVIWKLTGHKISEATLLASGQLWNIESGQVHFELLDQFGLSRDLISPLRSFGSSVDYIDASVLERIGPAWQDCLVSVGGGDSHFLHYGAVGRRNGAFVISAGSSTPISVILDNSKNFQKAQPWISPTFQNNRYFVEGNLGYPGSYYNWLMTKNGVSEIEASSIKSCTVNSIPVVLASCLSWSQESWERRPPFTIVNMKSYHSVSDIALSLIIDYAIGIKSQINSMNDSWPIEVVITGGGASSILGKVLATLMNQEIRINKSSEVALDGVFLLEGEGSPETFETFEPADSNTQANLIDFEILHRENYSSVENLKELIESVH